MVYRKKWILQAVPRHGKKKMVHTRTYIYIKFEDFCLLIWGLFITYLEVKNSYHAVSELQGVLKGSCLSPVPVDVECTNFR